MFQVSTLIVSIIVNIGHLGIRPSGNPLLKKISKYTCVSLN